MGKNGLAVSWGQVRRAIALRDPFVLSEIWRLTFLPERYNHTDVEMIIGCHFQLAFDFSLLPQ